MSLKPTVLEGERELIIGAERGDVRAAIVVPDDDQELDPDDVDRALDRLRTLATYELEGRRLVADGGIEESDRDRCENCGRDAGLFESEDGRLLCGLCIPADERKLRGRDTARDHDDVRTDGGVDQEASRAHCGRCGDFLPDGLDDGELCPECEARTEEPTILEVYPSDIRLLLKLATIGFVAAEALDDSDKYDTVPLDRPLDDVRLLLVDYARELDAGQYYEEDDLDPLAEALEAEGLL